MPPEGLDWIPGDELLSAEEIVRLVRIAVSEGVTQVRFTGGEPLVRPDLEAIIAGVAALPDAPSISLTTNGIGLASRAVALRTAGLTRVNISLDTLNRERFAALTRRDRLDDVLAGIAAATAAGLSPVKINTVLMRDVNDDEAVSLVQWGVAEGLQLRFIEQMPLDAHRSWDRAQMVEAGEILSRLGEALSLEPSRQTRGSEPAETWNVLDADGAVIGTVGVIGSVTRPFCGDCDRVRLTSDGQLRSCLFSQAETDLRGRLRAQASDEELAGLMRDCLAGKKAGHGIDDPTFLPPPRPMSAIGG
jgi:cyclic pyranopterin phosphate synthase